MAAYRTQQTTEAVLEEFTVEQAIEKVRRYATEPQVINIEKEDLMSLLDKKEQWLVASATARRGNNAEKIIELLSPIFTQGKTFYAFLESGEVVLMKEATRITNRMVEKLSERQTLECAVGICKSLGDKIRVSVVAVK